MIIVADRGLYLGNSKDINSAEYQPQRQEDADDSHGVTYHAVRNYAGIRRARITHDTSFCHGLFTSVIVGLKFGVVVTEITHGSSSYKYLQFAEHASYDLCLFTCFQCAGTLSLLASWDRNGGIVTQRNLRKSSPRLRYWKWTPAGMVRQVPGPTSFSLPFSSSSSFSQIRPRPSRKCQISCRSTLRVATDTALGGSVQWTTLASSSAKTFRTSAVSTAMASEVLDNCSIFQW